MKLTRRALGQTMGTVALAGSICVLKTSAQDAVPKSASGASSVPPISVPPMRSQFQSAANQLALVKLPREVEPSLRFEV